jgi:hypothetical protein
MFLTPADFTNKYELHTGIYDVAKLQSYIDIYEGRYLRQLFGSVLYTEFISDLDANNEPNSPNFKYIFFPFYEDVTLYQMLDSAGIIEMLKGFIYFEYSKDLLNQMTPYGNVRPKAENSSVVNTLQTMIYARYNEAITTYRAIRNYIFLNFNLPTNQIVFLQQHQNGIGYSSGNKSIIVAQGWLVAGAVDVPGTGYQVANNVPVTHSNGVGGAINILDVGVNGEILDFEISKGGYGFNVGGNNLYPIQTGGINAVLEFTTLGFSTGVITGNALIQVTAQPIGTIQSVSLIFGGSGGYGVAADLPLNGGSGFAGLIDVLAVDGSNVVTNVAVGSNGGVAYQVNDLPTIQGGNNDAIVQVDTITQGIITGINTNPLNQTLTTSFSIGDRVRITGNGNNVDAVYIVTYVGLGEFNTFNGQPKGFNYWI